MSTFTFRPAVRVNVPLLLGVAGGTGAGKTMSALRLARGLANGQPFALIDTENGRGLHYADAFPEMQHARLDAPFRPERYAEAILAGAAGHPVVVVDSMSHEWAGDGGCLDWHDELMGGDQKKNLSAWIKPKLSHKRMVTRLLQVNAHVILCFRAEPKVEAVRQPDGSTKIIEKPSLTGLNGWIPISEKMLPYELTASFLLMADKPGVPLPIKLQEQHRPMVPLDEPISEETGKRLAAWAAGTAAAEFDWTAAESLAARLLEIVPADARERASAAVATNRDSHKTDPAAHEAWLTAQITRAEATAAELAAAFVASDEVDESVGVEAAGTAGNQAQAASTSTEESSYSRAARKAQDS